MTGNLNMYDNEQENNDSDFAQQLSNVVRSSRQRDATSAAHDAARDTAQSATGAAAPNAASTTFEEVNADEDPNNGEDPTFAGYRATASDPAFGYVVGIAVAVGLAPLIGAGQADLRYTLSWLMLAIFGVLSWLFGNTARIDTESPDDIVWGVVFGLILGVPLYAFGSQTLTTAVELLFGTMSTGTLLAYLVFVIPLAETLFFRGVMQESRQFWMIGLMSALWSVIMFFPMMNVSQYAVVAFVICAVLLMMNMIYSYVRQRNGLAAAWVCQIITNLVVVFLPVIAG